MSQSISAGYPYRCTGIIALVLGLILLRISHISIQKLPRLISQNTGVAHIFVIAIASAEYVLAGIITSSQGPTHEAKREN